MKSLPKYVRYGLLFLFGVPFVLACTYFTLRDNIHPVIPGQFYRSAQLGPEAFARVFDQYHIKTVINLRGKSAQASWYEKELAASKKSHVNHVDILTFAYRMPRIATLRHLVSLLETAQRPILVHCQGGSDRTGLASALFVLLNNGTYHQARSEVSFRYFVIHKDTVGALVLPIYKAWLDANHVRSSKQNFLKWLAQTRLQPPKVAVSKS